jgi:hypothetical protein
MNEVKFTDYLYIYKRSLIRWLGKILWGLGVVVIRIN